MAVRRLNALPALIRFFHSSPIEGAPTGGSVKGSRFDFSLPGERKLPARAAEILSASRREAARYFFGLRTSALTGTSGRRRTGAVTGPKSLRAK